MSKGENLLEGYKAIWKVLCAGVNPEIKKTRHKDAFKEQKVHDIAGIARVTVS